MIFNTDQMLFTLPIMLKGMSGIFIVTLAIIAIIALLNKLTAPDKLHLKK